MDIKHFLITILSGIAGTLAITVIMYLYSYLSQHLTKVIHVLGNMLVGERTYYSSGRNVLIVEISNALWCRSTLFIYILLALELGCVSD